MLHATTFDKIKIYSLQLYKIYVYLNYHKYVKGLFVTESFIILSGSLRGGFRSCNHVYRVYGYRRDRMGPKVFRSIDSIRDTAGSCVSVNEKVTIPTAP